MDRRSKWMMALAPAVLAFALGGTARAAETSTDPTACSETESLHALAPTLAIVADDYEKQATEYAKQAERYRTWASAEDMFGAAYGKRYSAIYFADEASALDAEAAQSRALAAKYRRLATSPDAAKGC